MPGEKRRMKARVATFETDDRDLLQDWVDEIESLSEDGLPRGVPAAAWFVFQKDDEDGSKVMSIHLFETEDQLQEGDAILLEMGPPDRGRSPGASQVEAYDVVVQLPR
jgi:hypothetical protein